MKLYLDTETNKFISSNTFKSSLNKVEFVAGDAARVELIFVSGTTALSATADKSILFGIKQRGVFSNGELLVSDSVYTTSGTSYILSPSFDTVALNSLLNRNDGLSGNDIESVECSLQITWSSDAGATWTSSNILPTTIYHDLISGIEPSPSPNQSIIEWLNASIATNGLGSGTTPLSVISGETLTTSTAGIRIMVNGTYYTIPLLA